MAGLNADAISPDVTLAILAGGLGSRMGMPKAELKIDGRPILEYLLDQLVWSGNTMLVTAPGREHPPGSNRFSREVSDPQSGGGPLRGILTALEHLATPLLLVLTVDMPLVRPPHCKTLIDSFQNHPHAVGAMMRRAVNGSPRIEPFPCVLRHAAKPIVSLRLNEQRRSVHALLEDPLFVAVDAPPDWPRGIWTNLNFPADLDEFKTGCR